MRRIKQGERAYISYGEYMSLLQMSAKCATAVRIGKGYIRGWRLTFQGEAGNGMENIVPCHDGIVPAAVWAVSIEDEMELDKRYMYPTKYTKLAMTVLVNGKKIEGFTYVLNTELPDTTPSQSTRDVIKEGYSDNGFDICDWPEDIF